MISKDEEAMKDPTKRFDFLIDAVSASHALNIYLSLLKLDGVMVMVGIPPEAAPVAASDAISR